MASEPVAECIDLSKSYVAASGRVDALVEVEARFRRGAVTALTGPSGSGKSTLLRLLAGLDRPSHGDVLLEGRSTAWLPPRRARRLRRSAVTYLFQRPADNLVSYLTLAEHARLETGHSARGIELLRSFGLGHRLAQRPDALSGGEQARAAFALALARGTPLVVADEPTAELDERSAAALLDAVGVAAREGVAFVLATHDPAVTALAGDVLPLDHGRLAQSEAPAGAPAARRSAPAGPVVCAVDALRAGYRDGGTLVPVLEDVSLELRDGELAVLVGRSGSGKSTLLGVLAGWQAAQAGRVRYLLGGREVERPAELRWSELAVLPQKLGLLDELTVGENVQFPVSLAADGDRRSAWFERLVDELRLGDLLDRRPSETSLGQQQRTALARALVLEPRVLLLDEPTSHQDAGNRDRVLELLRGVTETGTAVLVATHEEAAAAHADMVWELSAGTLTPRV